MQNYFDGFLAAFQSLIHVFICTCICPFFLKRKKLTCVNVPVGLLGGQSVPTLISQMREEVLTSGVFPFRGGHFQSASLLVPGVTCKFRGLLGHLL